MYLNNTISYLSGPIGYAIDDGIGWRKYFKQKSKELGLNIKYIDPTNKPYDNSGRSVQEEKSYAKNLRNNKKWEELKEFVKDYRHLDLRYVDLSDFIVLYIDPKIHTVGTYDEAFTAERQQKPILTVVEGGIEALPDWMFAIIDLDTVFSNFDECLNYMVRLNNGEIKLNKKWILIRNDI